LLGNPPGALAADGPVTKPTILNTSFVRDENRILNSGFKKGNNFWVADEWNDRSFFT
jgi:hypothetical protein